MAETNFHNKIKEILNQEGIEVFSSIPFEEVKVINERLLPRDFSPKSVLMIAVPYRAPAENTDGLNVGIFARCKDYHLFFKELYEKVLPKIAVIHSGKSLGFADTSPIDEKDAALKAGLGFRGRNGLVTNSRIGSYIFIGSILFEHALPTDTVAPIDGSKAPYFSPLCDSCLRCVKSCPTGALGTVNSNGIFERAKCLSHISQKKKKTDSEQIELAETKTLWGCDICQSVCPFNSLPVETIPSFFENGYITNFSFEFLDKMPEDEFKTYAFSYRDKKVIVENFLTTSSDCDIIV